MNNDASFAWTHDRIEEFKSLFHKEKSFREIALIMSGRHGHELTRNAAIGKAHRLGLPKRGALTSELTSKINAKRLRTKKEKTMTIAAPSVRPPHAYAKRKVTEFPEPASRKLALLELEHRDCRWITGGERGAREFCGAKSIHGGQYCAYHTHMSLNPDVKKRAS